MHRDVEMTGLQVGDDLTLPLEAVTESFVIVGRRGTGKTSAAVVLVEEMLLAGQQVLAIDPTGVWWGLASTVDGLRPALPVLVLGGEHGHRDLEPGAGAEVARLAAGSQTSVVCDVSSLSRRQQRTFNAELLEHLYRSNREPLHVVIDEADLVAPQRATAGSEPLLSAAEDLVRRGRVRGLGTTLVTQRPASLHKDVLSQASTLIALQLTAAQDRRAIQDWIGNAVGDTSGHDVADSLPSLPVGTAWLASPGWLELLTRVTFRARRTFDSSRTPDVRVERSDREHQHSEATGDVIDLSMRAAGARRPGSAHVLLATGRREDLARGLRYGTQIERALLISLAAARPHVVTPSWLVRRAGLDLPGEQLDASLERLVRTGAARYVKDPARRRGEPSPAAGAATETGGQGDTS